MHRKSLELIEGEQIPFNQNGIAELELVERLGGGSFGSVWKTIDIAQQQIYTLKVIQNTQKGIDVERVRLEAGVTIASEYIIPVIGLLEWNPNTYLILFNYFEGKALDQLLREKTLTDAQKRTIFNQILYGVSDAHRHNIIHRDLKPANILVSEDLRVKLIDFGISKFKDINITGSGLFLGTLPYAAPEVILKGARHADATSDIYALGQILYELVTEQNFWHYKGWNSWSDIFGFLHSTPPPTEVMDLTQFYCDFYPGVNQLLLRMVKVNPAHRFSSVEEIIKGIGLIGEELSPAVSNYSSPFLIIESGTNRNARTFLSIAEGDAVVMGRADFAGNDRSISRKHIEIRRQENRYLIRDLNSNYGTMIGGRLLSPEKLYELHFADRIKIGDIFLRFASLQQPLKRISALLQTTDRSFLKVCPHCAASNINSSDVCSECKLPLTDSTVDRWSAVQRRADIMFILDCTESMEAEIDAIRNTIISFVESLQSAGLNIRVGLIEFRDRLIEEEHRALQFNGQPFTADPRVFRREAMALQAWGGGDAPESSLDALLLALRQPFDPCAQKILVLITNAPPHVPDKEARNIKQVTKAMRAAKISQLYLIIPVQEAQTYLPLCDGMRGTAFDLGSGADFQQRAEDFRRTLLSLGKTISAETL